MGVRILWVVLIGFLAGVFVRSHLSFGLGVIGFLVAIGLPSLLPAAIKKSPSFLLLSIACFACALGVMRMEASIIERAPEIDLLLGEKIVLEGVVFEEPDIRETHTRLLFRADTLFFGGARSAVDARALASVPLHTPVSYGDRVSASGALSAPETFETGEGREFNYPGYLAKSGILYELSFAEVEVIGEGSKNPLKAFAISAKGVFVDGLARTLPEPHAGLAAGITAGDKRGLGEDLSEVFRAVGLTHIVVLSGYNIMVVVEALSRVFSKVSPLVRFFGGSIVALLFALMTGLASASVRAAAMAIIALFGRATGRTYVALRALFFIAAGMVAWNPYILVFDIGFQLSVIATWGLIVFTPLFSRIFSFVPEHFGMREIASATLATQAAVLPILLYQSGIFSLVSLPANLFALIAVPLAMLFSAVAGAAGIVFGELAAPLALPAHLLLSYIIGVSRFFAALPLSSVSVPAFSAWWLCAMYAALLFLAYKKRTARFPSGEPARL